MTRFPLVLASVALSAALGLVGCGVETERPPGESTEPATAPELALETPVTTTATTEAPPPVPLCTAGSTRECKINWGYNGTEHCLMSLQTCRADGSWTACGKPAASATP